MYRFDLYILTKARLSVMCCANWYHLYNSKNVKNTHRGVFTLVELQASACNFTEFNTPPWVFFTFFKLCKWHQIVQRTTSELQFRDSYQNSSNWMELQNEPFKNLQYSKILVNAVLSFLKKTLNVSQNNKSIYANHAKVLSCLKENVRNFQKLK